MSVSEECFELFVLEDEGRTDDGNSSPLPSCPCGNVLYPMRMIGAQGMVQ